MMTAKIRQALTDLPVVREVATVLPAALLVVAVGLAFPSAAPVFAESDDEDAEAVEQPVSVDEIDCVEYIPVLHASEDADEIECVEHNPYSDSDDLLATNPSGELDLLDDEASTEWRE